MSVKVQDYTERRALLVLEAMILHSSMLGRVVVESQGKPLFDNPSYDTALRLLTKFYERHGKSPGKNFPNLVRSWGEDHPDREADYKLLEQLARAIGNDYAAKAEEVNAEYVADLAGQLFSDVAIRTAIRKAEDACRRGHTEKAFEYLANARKVELGEDSRGRFLNDDSEIDAIFADSGKPLVTYGGALGQLFADALMKESFVAFMAPEKTGKSFMLLDLAFAAIRQRKKVAFFEAGDSTKKQIGKRFFSHIACHPFRSTNMDLSWPCIVRYPIGIDPPLKGQYMASVVHEEKSFKHPLDKKISKEARDQFQKETLKSYKDYFYSSCHPGRTINVFGIKAKLQRWEADGWIPDVVIVDYADLLADPPGRREKRDHINETWQLLRSLSIERHCLVVTATQANAKSYSQDTLLSPANFADSKTKYASVTAIFGMIMTPAEKDAGLVRMNCVFRREGESNWQNPVHIARCLPFAQTHVHSCW